MNMILGLCVGVGARLIPMILGTGCAKPYGVKEMWLIGLLLVGSSFIEIYVNEFWHLFEEEAEEILVRLGIL